MISFSTPQIFDIIGYVYQYLKLLRQLSPQEWIFKELQDMGNLDFRFAEEKPQDDYAAELAGAFPFPFFNYNLLKNSDLTNLRVSWFAEKLLVYPPEHVIYGDYVFEFWDEEMIRKILGFFTPENMRIDVVSKSFKSQGTFSTPIFSHHKSVMFCSV